MRYRPEKETKTGWTRWIAPKMDGYKMRCCDCGLVHVVQFKALEDLGEKDLDLNREVAAVKVAMRVKRDNRATAQIRRKR